MDHIEKILILITVSLPILLLLNLLNKNVCKYYPIVFALRYTLVLLLPRDYGDTANDFIYLQIISTFIMTVFNLWVSAFAFMVPVGASIAAQVIHYGEDSNPGSLVLKSMFVCLFFALNFLVIVSVIFSMGNLVVKNHVLLKGNEKLLNSLKQGLIIAQSNDGELVFANAAAKQLSR